MGKFADTSIITVLSFIDSQNELLMIFPTDSQSNGMCAHCCVDDGKWQINLANECPAFDILRAHFVVCHSIAIMPRYVHISSMIHLTHNSTLLSPFSFHSNSIFKCNYMEISMYFPCIYTTRQKSGYD